MRALVICAFLAAMGCQKAEESASQRASGAAGSRQVAATPAQDDRRFCVMDLRVGLDVRHVPDMTAASFRHALLETLARARPPVELSQAVSVSAAVPGLDRCVSAGRDRAVGLLVRASAAVLGADGKVLRIQDATAQDELTLSVAVHAERGGADGRPEIGASELTAAVPLGGSGKRAPGDFVRVRLVRAAGMAASDALGQLVVRGIADDKVLAMLDDREAWRQLAALREVGERGLVAGRARAESAATSSRKDLALVAIGALGRLGDPASLGALRNALDARAVEVVDAAMLAIADIGGPEAQRTIGAVATEHRSPWIRRRAAHLLEQLKRRK